METETEKTWLAEIADWHSLPMWRKIELIGDAVLELQHEMTNILSHKYDDGVVRASLDIAQGALAKAGVYAKPL